MNQHTSPDNREDKSRRQKIADGLRAARSNLKPLPRGLIGNVVNRVAVTVSRIFLRIEVRGRENVPLSNPYVLAANHETYVDGMWIAAYLRKGQFRHFCSLAAADLEYKHGWLGKVILRVGRGIRVDRFGNPLRGLIAARKEVEQGGILLVHPEGTRTRDGELGEFKDGASYVACRANVPLLPVFISGGYEIFSRHMKNPEPFYRGTLRRKRLQITFGEPLMPSEYHSVQEMTDALVHWMREQHRLKREPLTPDDTSAVPPADR